MKQLNFRHVNTKNTKKITVTVIFFRNKMGPKETNIYHVYYITEFLVIFHPFPIISRFLKTTGTDEDVRTLSYFQELIQEFSTSF